MENEKFTQALDQIQLILEQNEIAGVLIAAQKENADIRIHLPVWSMAEIRQVQTRPICEFEARLLNKTHLTDEEKLKELAFLICMLKFFDNACNDTKRLMEKIREQAILLMGDLTEEFSKTKLH